MKLNQWTKALIIACSIVTVTACSSAKKHDQYAINDANASYNDAGAQSSGLGNESGFDDQAGGNKHLAANKNVYYFDFDSNAVHPEDRPVIEAKAEDLAAHPRKKILLEGHTDPRGSREYNIGLGERRSKSVAQIMASKGVNPSQIRVVSYGAEKLAANGHSEEDYQQDRRAVIVNVQN